MKQGQSLWTRDELIITLNLYCKLPFGKMHTSNPEVIRLSALLGRTVGSIAFKLGNFASFDHELQARGVKGASNASKLDRAIWNEFYDNWNELPFESEKLLAEKEEKSIEKLNGIDLNDLPKGEERERVVKTRVNQNFFRKSILASYNNTCCITGLAQPELLVAGHIRPWSLDEHNRLNPRNGIAINALHDKAFENGLITITTDHQILVSSTLLAQKKSAAIDKYFKPYHNKQINLPTKFFPDPEFLRYHREERFQG